VDTCQEFFSEDFVVNSKLLLRNKYFYLLKFCSTKLLNSKFLRRVLIGLFKPQHLKTIDVKFDEKIFNDYLFLKILLTKILSSNIYRKIFQNDIFRFEDKYSIHRNKFVIERVFVHSDKTDFLLSLIETSFHFKCLMVYQLSNLDHIKLFNN
jgi:hypothetical protein